MRLVPECEALELRLAAVALLTAEEQAAALGRGSALEAEQTVSGFSGLAAPRTPLPRQADTLHHARCLPPAAPLRSIPHLPQGMDHELLGSCAGWR